MLGRCGCGGLLNMGIDMDFNLPLRICAVFAALFTSASFAQAPDQRWTRPQSGATIEEVLVTGEHPGPSMWRVTNGENVLWILGTHAPLPEAMRWRSQEVELAISEAQQVLANYSASIAMRGGNPLATEGKPLRRLLTRKQYAQWRTMKLKYIGPNDAIERALPVTAALVLRSNALDRAGLTSADSIWREIARLAGEYHVPVTTAHQVTRVVDEVRSDVAAEGAGVKFLVETMANLESDIRAARMRANAWAVGDIEALRMQAAADKDIAQLYASSWPFLSEADVQALTRETDLRWVDAADEALRSNRTTVATLPIFLLLRSDGLLSALRARGFEVEAPNG